jgi:hypothetical protein
MENTRAVYDIEVAAGYVSAKAVAARTVKPESLQFAFCLSENRFIKTQDTPAASNSTCQRQKGV